MSENGKALDGEISIGGKKLDSMCWLILSSRNRFYPIRETAKECVNVMEDRDDSYSASEHTRGHELGYHAGMFVAYDEIVDQLCMEGVDVVARANRYLDANRDAGMELRTEDQSDYFEPIEGGSEHPDKLLDSIEIEEIGEASYEVQS